MLKKICRISFLTLICAVVITGCGNKEKSLNLSPTEIINKVYASIPENDIPNLVSTEITQENMAYYLGTDSLDIKSGVASEPLISSIPWSVVVVELNDKADVNASKEEIKSKVNPAKWICVGAEEVIVESRGNKIILIMMDEEKAEYAKTIQKNFKNL